MTAFTFAFLTCAFLAEAARPNILVIVADDLGYADIGVHGCKDIPTPHIDALAAGGVRCAHAYVSAPYGSPTRAGLLTGRYQTRFGHEFNPGGGQPGAGLPPGEVTLAERLKSVGYTTGLVGKWHLGTAEGRHPLDRGFDEFFGFLGAAHGYFPGQSKSQLLRGRESAGEMDYLTDAFAREATAYIGRNKSKPWFLLLAFNAVHDPMQPKPDDLAKAPNAEGRLRKPYAGMLVALDEAVGEVMQKVRALGLEENTLVFFVSDNGGPTSRLNANLNESSNEPFRGGKRQLLEGGIRVPFIVSWKGRLPARKVYPHPVIQLDIFSTALAAAGIAVDPQTVDGLNLIPYLDGTVKEPPREALFWRFGRQWAVREGNWKLVTWKDDSGTILSSSLYHLRNDPGETRDLSLDSPRKVRDLRNLWEKWNAGNTAPGWGTEAELKEACDLATAHEPKP